ncbi:MAG TPA: hypothetical protein VFQ61_12790 [Polyangiaceae bacterium]|nr:hypothetical protein [Polyangiaceae bacterium]
MSTMANGRGGKRKDSGNPCRITLAPTFTQEIALDDRGWVREKFHPERSGA